MRSLLARVGLKRKRRDDETAFAPILHSGTKGDGAAPQLNGVRYFSFEELKRCTHNFSENNKLAEGFFGEVYKGYCTNGVVVAIKRVKKGTPFSRMDFQSEIVVLSRVHHKNIVRLVGYCCEQEEQLLVYEYISNFKGTLFHNLAGEGGMYLDWMKRLHIALDTARGLAYLHELANPPIIHGHVTSDNIMLDGNLNAKVMSFVLSKVVHEKQKGQLSSQVKRALEREEPPVKSITGTPGYMAPEYCLAGRLSEKSDVYGFGVVMLELIYARWPIKEMYVNNYTFPVEEVKRAIDENDHEYFGLKDIIHPKIVDQARNVSLRKFVQLALRCLEYSASDRPSMNEIMKEIDTILQHDGQERTANVDSSHDFGNDVPVLRHRSVKRSISNN